MVVGLRAVASRECALALIFKFRCQNSPPTDKLRVVYIASVAYKIVSIQYWLMTIDRDYSHRSQSPNKI